MDLKTRLASACDAWCDARSQAGEAESKPRHLALAVTGNHKFFADLPDMARGPSTDTLESFARYLADPANWPEGEVAQEAVDLAHVTGVSPITAAPSAGIAGESSPVSERDAA